MPEIRIGLASVPVMTTLPCVMSGSPSESTPPSEPVLPAVVAFDQAASLAIDWPGATTWITPPLTVPVAVWVAA